MKLISSPGKEFFRALVNFSHEGDSLLIAVEMNDVQASQRLLADATTNVNMVDELGKTAGLHLG